MYADEEIAVAVIGKRSDEEKLCSVDPTLTALNTTTGLLLDLVGGDFLKSAAPKDTHFEVSFTDIIYFNQNDAQAVSSDEERVWKY